MEPLRRIVIGPPASGRSSWLRAELRRALPAGALVLALAPTEASAAALRTSLGRTPGVETRSMRAWALELLRMAPEAVGLREVRVVSALERRMLLAHAWRDVAERGGAPLLERYG